MLSSFFRVTQSERRDAVAGPGATEPTRPGAIALLACSFILKLWTVREQIIAYTFQGIT